jgi:hypothetical protein
MMRLVPGRSYAVLTLALMRWYRSSVSCPMVAADIELTETGKRMRRSYISGKETPILEPLTAIRPYPGRPSTDDLAVPPPPPFRRIWDPGMQAPVVITLWLSRPC